MRVLIVEDELKMAALIQRGLCEAGMAADTAVSGGEALRMAKATDYDVVALDLMLPGIDGLELLQRMRAEGVWSPVLMLSARMEAGDRRACLDAGADDYLAKPFSFAELIVRLRSLAPRGPA